MVRLVFNIHDTYRPVDFYLKIIGFVPPFEGEKLTLSRRVLNGTHLVLNVLQCILVTFVIQSDYQQLVVKGINFGNFLGNNYILRMIPFLVPLTAIVAGFAQAERARCILRQLNEADYKV